MRASPERTPNPVTENGPLRRKSAQVPSNSISMNPEYSSGGYKNRHFPLLSKSVESAVLPGLASERQPLCRTGKSTRDWRGCKMEERHYVFPKQEILERYIRVIAKHAGKRIMQ